MARYVLNCITVNGVAEVESPEVTITMDADKTVRAIYMEAQPVSVTMKNVGTEDKTVKKVTILVETVNIPAGGTVTILYDPTHDVIEIS